MTADTARHQRYTSVAIALHWTIALLIVGMLCLGFYMNWIEGGPGSPKLQLIQLHKSIGVTVLILSVARVAWRLMNPPPPEPPMPALQKLVASAVHIALYVLIIAMPLSGWIMASLSSAHGTLFFGTVNVAATPLSQLPDETRKPLESTFGNLHLFLAWVIIAMLALHVAGALKHQIVDKDGLMARMAPGVFGRTSGPPDHGHGAFWTVGAAAVVFAAIAGLGMASAPSASAPTSTAVAVNDRTALQPGQPAPVMASPAPVWNVDAAQSSIVFKSAYMGRAFEGRFNGWTANIQFDPAKPEDARIKVTIPMADAASKKSNIATGQPYFDDNVTQGDWFNTAKFPAATFSVNEGVMKNADGSYEATGVLNLKGQDIPVRLPFTLTITGSQAKMHGTVKLMRTALGLGKDTRTSANPKNGDEEWVQDAVDVVVDVTATRQ